MKEVDGARRELLLWHYAGRIADLLILLGALLYIGFGTLYLDQINGYFPLISTIVHVVLTLGTLKLWLCSARSKKRELAEQIAGLRGRVSDDVNNDMPDNEGEARRPVARRRHTRVRIVDSLVYVALLLALGQGWFWLIYPIDQPAIVRTLITIMPIAALIHYASRFRKYRQQYYEDLEDGRIS